MSHYILYSHVTPEGTLTTTELPVRAGTKLALMINLLQRPSGACMDELCELTGWQPTTVRSTMNREIKKRLQLTIQTSTGFRGNMYYAI